jgi:subfamily B ATP-binding cassette protein MsbA
LLGRLYEPDEGRIVADGTPIDRFAVDAWRSRVAVVPQKPHIFDETLRYNLTFGAADADDDRVERSCEVAQVTEFLDELPDGYDTVLGDDGVRLSGGQRQRVAIARALLRDADVLVLDEATSDLDGGLEERVYEAITALDREYAVVVITHRLGTIADADRIHAIEDGRITETGGHRELLERDGTYADLYAARSRGQ